MSFLGGFFKNLTGLVLGALAVGLVLGLVSATAGPTASFTMTPAGNPVVGQAVQFSDTSTGSPTSWFWTFGDGQTSNQQSPVHVYAVPGPFIAALTASNADGPSAPHAQPLIVSTKDTLRLNASHPFTVTLTTTNQHDNDTRSAGQAIPQSDLFGYFSLPGATSNPDNPEVFIKILDGRTINGQFWVFFGHLTDLVYDLTVTEVATGFVKTYHKDGGNAVGGFDTSGFHASPTPTTTPTVTLTPTPTPTGSALIVTNLVASDFEWNFDNNGPQFTMRVGQAYRINISRANGSHQFTGLQKSVSPFNNLFCSGSNFPTVKVCNITPTAADIGTYFFGCSVSSCGSPGHDSMLNGVVNVVP